MIFFFAGEKKTGGLHNRDKDTTNRAVIASEQKKGNKAKKEGELKSLPRPIRYIDFQFPYPYTSQYTETRMSSKVRVLNESLFVLFTLLCHRMSFSLHWSAEAGQKSLQKTGQWVFRWTDQSGEWP